MRSPTVQFNLMALIAGLVLFALGYVDLISPFYGVIYLINLPVTLLTSAFPWNPGTTLAPRTWLALVPLCAAVHLFGLSQGTPWLVVPLMFVSLELVRSLIMPRLHPAND